MCYDPGGALGLLPDYPSLTYGLAQRIVWSSLSRESFILKHLLQHLSGKLLIVWDGLPAHRSRKVRAFYHSRVRPAGSLGYPCLVR